MTDDANSAVRPDHDASRRDSTVVDLFEAVRSTHPHATAIEIPGAGCTSYSELDAMSRKVAARIAPIAARDAVVAIALPRNSHWLYASMLGVMRAGAAYVAIDPSFPARQAAAILADSGAVALIAEPARARELHDAGARIAVIAPDELERSAAADPGAHRARADALAYVIYTSGTTGKPKGVEITHRSLLNLVEGDRAEFGLGPADRAAQGSSASYDSSVEEIWLAWAVGATLVVMDDATARLGPDLLPWLVHHRITVLCPPPTLLRTLACDDPGTALPLLRFLYVGGEALPSDIADLWSRGRRLENGYGPTECTVTCLRATVRPGEPVTIGRAIPGSFAAVVDPDSADLREIEDGSHGELVVGGASLARGYRGQPETTAARFIEHPSLGRIYRTGDLVHRDERGDFHYHGRIDAQVKLRGYRIELGAIEARLAAHPSVREAACTVEGEGTLRRLVAHCVPAVVDGAVNAEQLRAFIAQELPPYMVPATVVAIAALPRSIGGKLDRKRLPPTDAPCLARADDPPVTPTERAVAAAVAHALGRDDPSAIPASADFFDDLGLDSLTVAIAISRLRGSAATRAATVRSAYQHRTVRAIAHELDRIASDSIGAAAPSDGARASDEPASGVARPFAFGLGQCAFLLGMLVIAAQLTWIPSGGSWLEGVLEHPWTMLPAALGFALASLVAYMAATLAAAAAAKWILIGRYRPGRVQAWSSLHLRHWIVTRLAALAPWDFLETTGFAPHALRLFGAQIGRGVHIHRGVRLVDGGWDLLTLEDGATIGQDACIRAVELDRGTLLFGTVTVRRDATLETRAGMSPGAELGEGSILRPLSNLRGGPSPARTIFDGVPALAAGAAPDPPVVRTRPRPVLVFVAANAVTAAVVATLLVPWILAWSILESQSTGSLHGFLFHSDSWIPSLEGIVRLLATVALAGVATVLIKAMLVRMLGPAPRGAYALSGLDARRMALQSMLVEAAGKWLSGTLMWPIWLNLAGARIGRGCEISTVTDVVPSTVTIGRETFFADGIYLGGPTLHAGTARLDPVTLGESCFVGNHAVLPGGTTLAEGTLVGISTRGDGIPHEPGTSWFGHPAFRLPRREIVEMPRELTHDPTLIRRINRWCWEVARFGLPVVPVLAGLAWFRAMEDAERSLGMTSFRLIALPAALLAVFCSLALATLTLKWILIGRVRPGTHALWSCWCSRWDFLYVAWGLWASIPLGFLEGTRILVLYLRAMGCRIGRRALLGHGFAHVVDPDMLRFGDDVTVDALFQAHTFEDRVLKVDFVDLRDGSSVGPNTVLLYGAEIGEGASVAPHSVVMKREVLPGGFRYEGVPTQPA